MLDFDNSRVGYAPILRITPEMAKKILGEHSPSWQRPESKARVKKYAREMEAGEFGNWSTIHFVQEPDGELRLVNGQHRLRAVIESNTPQEFIIVMNKVEDVETARKMYATIDDAKLKTKAEALKAMGIFEKSNLSIREIGRLSAAVDTLYRIIINQDKVQWSVYELEQTINKQEYDKLFVALCDIFKSATPEVRKAFVNRSAAAACCLLILKINPIKGSSFLTEIAEESAGVSFPSNSLRNFMIMNKSSGGGSVYGDVHGISKELQIKAFAICWNAYLDDEKVAMRALSIPLLKGHGAVKFGNYLV